MAPTFLGVVIISLLAEIPIFAYLKAGLEAGTKAEAEARHAAMQNTVFMVKILHKGRL